MTGATFVTLQAVIGAIAGALALSIAMLGDDGVVRALNIMLSTLDVTAAYPLASMILLASIGLVRTRVLSRWFVWFGAVAAIIVLLHGTNWSRSGFGSATGGYLWLTIGAGVVWAAVTSWLLYAKAPSSERAPEAAATSAT